MYLNHFSLFLDIEESLLRQIKQLEYTDKSKSIYSYKLSLLLLQTCPVIESYMVTLATSDSKVLSHDLYNWEHNTRLWKSKEGKFFIRDGKRQIETFPKFSYVNEKTFQLSLLSVKFFHSHRFQNVEDINSTTEFIPFKTLSSFVDFRNYSIKKNFPVGLNTPKWWSAYNKTKHSIFSDSKNYVTYSLVIESISALFLLLAYCSPDLKTLAKHGYVKDNTLQTSLFSATL